MSICYKAAILNGSSISQASGRYYLNLLYIFVSFNLVLPFTACGEHYDFEGTDDLNWNDCDGTSWYQDCSMGYKSNHSLRSGPIEYLGVSSICKKVPGPARITFYWNSDTTFKEGSQLLFMVDDDVKRVYTTYGWRFESYSIRGEGNHTINWVFRKFRYMPQWKGSGWIDDLNIFYVNDTKDLVNKYTYNSRQVGDVKTINGHNDTQIVNDTTGDLSQPFIPRPELSVNMTMSSYEVLPNTNITVHIFIKNVGNVYLNSVVVLYDLPYGLMYNEDNLNGTQEENTLKWDIGSLNVNESLMIELVVNTSGSRLGRLVNNVTVTGKYLSKGHEYNVHDSDIKDVIIPCFYVKEIADGKYNFTTIGEAVDSIYPSGIIYVDKKMCAEVAITIDKPLSIVGLDEPLIYDLSNGNDCLIKVTNTSDVVIESIKINRKNKKQGISIINANNISIINTTIMGTGTNIFIYNCSNIYIINNTLAGFTPIGYGVHVIKWNNISIYNSNISNQYIGIGVCPQGHKIEDLIILQEILINNNHNIFSNIAAKRYVRFTEEDC